MRSSARACFERCARRQPREYLGHAVLAAADHGGREMMRAGDHVGDDLRRHRVGNRRLKHADNRWRSARRCSSPSRTVLPITLGSECSWLRQNL